MIECSLEMKPTPENIQIPLKGMPQPGLNYSAELVHRKVTVIFPHNIIDSIEIIGNGGWLGARRDGYHYTIPDDQHATFTRGKAILTVVDNSSSDEPIAKINPRR